MEQVDCSWIMYRKIMKNLYACVKVIESTGIFPECPGDDSHVCKFLLL